jgi:hypothetical protein
LCAVEALRLLANVKVSRLALALTCALAALMYALGVQGPHAMPFIAVATGLLGGWFVAERTSFELNRWLPAAVTLTTLLATYLCIPPNCGVPKYNLSQDLLEPTPLDRSRLYLSVYPYPEFSYRAEAHPAPIGQELRPGSTSMWAGLRFVTGYSPIRPAGVARLFNTGIHGQVDFDLAGRMLNEQAGSNGELAKLGVDGVIVARSFDLRPQPESEWQLAYSSADAVVYHRAGAALLAARAFWDPELTQRDESATLRVVEDSRNRIVLDCNGDPEDELPVFVAVSRPFFPGYIANANGAPLEVSSYRGLMPIVELPPGFTGRLTLTYRPTWLVWGGIAAISCTGVLLLGIVAAAITRGRHAVA